MKARIAMLLLPLALVACGQIPAVPDITYYRLPPPAAIAPGKAVLFSDPVVVESLDADGLYADQALIYALHPQARELRQYHYQLWTDPPRRTLQRRLLGELRDARVSALVTDQLPVSTPAVRVSGVILRYDRVPNAGDDAGYHAVVALKLRASAADGTPLIEDYYRAEAPASGVTLNATVTAFGGAIDEIFARFHADLVKHMEARHAR